MPLEAFFAGLDGPIDHVLATAGGPYYAPLAEMDFDEARRAIAEHPMLMVGVARYTAPKERPGGALLFMGGTGGRRPSLGVGIVSAMTAALPALAASLALAVHLMTNTALTGATFDIDGGQQLA